MPYNFVADSFHTKYDDHLRLVVKHLISFN